MNLHKKVLLGFIIFIIAPLFLLGWFSYSTTERLIESKYGEQTDLTLKAIGRNIRYMLKEANYFSDYYAFSVNDIQNIFSEMQSSHSEKNENTNLSYEMRIRRSLLTYTPIQSVSLYSLNGNTTTASNIQRKLIAFEDLKQSPVYPELFALNGKPKWVGPGEDQALTGQDRFFYQLRVVKDFYTLDNRGVMLLQVRLYELDKIFNLYNANRKRSQRFMLVNHQGLVLYDNLKQLQGQNLSDQTEERIKLDNSISGRKIQFENAKSLLSTYNLNLDDLGAAGWTIVSISPWQYVTGEIERTMKWVAAILSLILLSALVFNFAFVNRYIRFILKVSGAMKKVERGDLTTRVEMATKDETAVLAKGFNSLVFRIHELLEEVRHEQQRKIKAEMMVLQAQIKPHFLFNTLEAINALAMQNEGKKVSRMVHRLGNIFRISIQEKEEISIEQEIEHLRSYLEIQKYRFEDVFDFIIDIPAQLMDDYILKLTLQPLVENSIQHGFEGIDDQGRLCVTAQDEGDRLAFMIEDNGIGIPNEILAGFQYKLDDDSTMNEQIPLNRERRGLGVRNVADRLRIHYGSGYGLFICSEQGKGTKIKCVIPKYKPGENHES